MREALSVNLSAFLLAFATPFLPSLLHKLTSCAIVLVGLELLHCEPAARGVAPHTEGDAHLLHGKHEGTSTVARRIEMTNLRFVFQ